MSHCKKAISVFLVIMLIMVHISPAATFSHPDTTGHWAEGEIRQLVGIGAITGYPDGTYRPQDTITRAEFSSVVRGTLNLQEVKGSTFSDVVGHWAQGRIEALIKEGIIDPGVYGLSYGPDEPITREEIAMMASRMVGKHGEPQSIPFNDAEEIRPAFRSDVIKAYQAGIITGYPDNTFRPAGTATRAEAAVMVTRALIADTIKDRSVGNTAVSGEYTTIVPFEDQETMVKVVVNDTMTGQPLEGIAVELIVTDKTVELFLHDPRGDYLPEVFVFEQEILDEYPEVERGSIIIAVGLIAWGALKTYSLATFLMGGIAIMKGTKVVTTTWLVKTIAKTIAVNLATQAIYTGLMAYISRDGKLNYPTTFYVFEEPDGASAQIVKVPAGATGKEIDNAIRNITGDVEIEIKLPPENAKGAYYYPDGTPKFYYVYPVRAFNDRTGIELIEEQMTTEKYRKCPPMNWERAEVDPQIEASLGRWIDENLGLKMRWFSFREGEGIWSRGYLDIHDHAIIENHVWAVGSKNLGYGFIFHSLDSGKSWEIQWQEPVVPFKFSGSYPFITYFINGNKGWVGSKSGIYCTHDGGINWEFYDVGGKGAYIMEYWFYSNEQIDVRYAYGGTYTSFDGGKTWNEINH